MTKPNKFKIADESDEYIITEVVKYDAFVYERIKKQDEKLGY